MIALRQAGNPPEPWQEAFQSACGFRHRRSATCRGVSTVSRAGSWSCERENLTKLCPSGKGSLVSIGTLALPRFGFCVDVLGARRIAHGVLAADDSTLIAHLAKLNVCSEPGNYNTFMESHYHESRLHVYDFNAWVLGQRS